MTESFRTKNSIQESIDIRRTQFYCLSPSYDLKEKIIQLQKSQKLLKQSIIETDVCLKSPQMKHRESIMQESFNRQKFHFQVFCQQFKKLPAKQRRPYETMLRKFKEKVNEHNDEIRLAISEPEEHEKKLQNLRQVWFQNQEREEEEWKFLLRYLVGIFGAFLIHVMIGGLSRWTMINPYITSFYKMTSDPNLEIRKNSFVSPLSTFCTGLTMKFGLKLCNKYHPILMIMICAIGMSASTLISAFSDRFLQFVFFHNVLYGLFGGMIFLTVLKQCHNYFPKYRLICNSFIMTGTGIGAVFFAEFNINCMNPHHQKPLDTGLFADDSEHVARNFPICFKQMSVVIPFIGIVAALCLYPLISYNRKEEEIKLQKGEAPDFENSCYTEQQALKSRVFWMLALMVICSTVGNYFMTSNYKNFIKAQSNPNFKNNDYTLTVLLTGYMCSAFFGIFWGFTFRSLGFKYTYIIAICSNIVVFSCLLTVNLNQVTYMVLFSLHFIVQGAWGTIFSNACLLIFGDIIGDSIYGFYYALFALSHFCQYLVSSNMVEVGAFVRDNVTFFSVPQNIYKIPLYPVVFMGVIGLMVCSVTKFQGRWENSLKLLTLACDENETK